MSTPAPNADLELLRRIAQGDSAALGQFYDHHSGTLFALALRILNDHKEAEDVLQEAFLQIWEKAAAFEPAQGRPLAWAITLTRNKAIDRLRSVQRRARLAEEAATELLIAEKSALPSASATVGAAEQARMVRVSLTKLPADQKRAIEMAFFDGLTQAEIAVALNKPLGTIKARIRRGMLKLRKELVPWLGEDKKEMSPRAASPGE